MSDLPLVLVVAMAENRVIGRDGDLPWRLSDDLKHFKRVTLGCPVIMGRTTWASIGHPLPGRANIVLSRREDFAPDGAEVARSLDDALAHARASAARSGAEAICVIGGGHVYREALPLADRLWLTVVEADVDGDTVFPEVDPEGWVISQEGRIEPDAKNDHPARIERWERR